MRFAFIEKREKPEWVRIDQEIYFYEIGPVQNDRDGWEAIFTIAKALDKKWEIERINCPGPYWGEHDFSDIGCKDFKDVKKLVESIDKLLEDENDEAVMSFRIGSDSLEVEAQVILKRVRVKIRGPEEAIKKVAAEIKKAVE